jgi:excisionase family DNA binding protein
MTTTGDLSGSENPRITVGEVARRLKIGRRAVYAMLEEGVLPGIRIGNRWLITRYAYGHWERKCGTGPRFDFRQTPS